MLVDQISMLNKVSSRLIFAALAFALARGRLAAEVTYEKLQRKGPATVHVVQAPLRSPTVELRTMHAFGKPLGLAPVSSQAALVTNAVVLAAINADYYERAGDFAGDVRGVQIMNGSLISNPGGNVTFWIDPRGQPQVAVVESRIQLMLSDGRKLPLTVNEFRGDDEATIYSPTVSRDVVPATGRSYFLEFNEPSSQVLATGQAYTAKVHAASGNDAAGMLLSIGPAINLPALSNGAELRIITATQPSLRGVREAISGGPLLVIDGKAQKFSANESDAYNLSTMIERHPRSAVGWNNTHLFLVAVDGRQKNGSVGMTLDELSAFLVELGCTAAMNLDGGGSSTLWHEGKVKNFLADGYERDVANSLLIVKTR
ncbi:MAG TPA: phosphodiester glycosidase family protein [Methylomirabilota bacterium]|nr:phosphodiester glycosidase family protein [Methylomirabilota bacterium]